MTTRRDAILEACGRTLRFAQYACVVAAALAISARSAEADDAPNYRVAIAAALERYRAADWDGAREVFEQAYAIEPGARALRGMALSAYYAHDYLAAANAFERALAEERQALTPEQRAEVRDLLGRVYQYVVEVRTTTRPAGALASIDGKPMPASGRILLMPGRYRVDVVAPGCQPRFQEIDVGAGQQLSLHIELAPDPAANVTSTATKASAPERPPLRSGVRTTPARKTEPARRSAALWAAAGTTGALAVLAGTFALLTRDELHDLRATCARRGCSSTARAGLWRESPIETYETLTNVTLVASALGAGATVALLLWTPKAHPDGRKLSLQLRGASFRLSGRF